MDTLRPQILSHLDSASEPVTAHHIATAIATAADAAEVRNYLRILVQQGKVQRHHSSDGILRYSLAGTALHPSPAPSPTSVAPAPAPGPVPAPAPKTEHATSMLPTRLQTQMLGMLSATPQSAGELIRRGPFTKKQVSNLLQHLQSKGLVVKHGGMGNCTWSLADGVTRPALPPATTTLLRPAPTAKPASQPSDLQRNNPAGGEEASRVLKALESNHTTANDALDLYIASVVDPTIFAALKLCASEAQRALDAFNASGRAPTRVKAAS
jgi:hypothetical protein